VKKRNSDEYDTHTKTLHIPMIYLQVITQLVAEDRHGISNTGHEALRRQSYARQVLDKVGIELRGYKGDGSLFRSTVLNPILQRQMRGVPDVYTPSVCAAISGDDEPTIADVTTFYLGKDPVDDACLSIFHRNLLYVPQSRWFLAVLLEVTARDDIEHYNKVLVNHDKLMEALALNDDADTNSSEESSLTLAELEVILDEGLVDYFEGLIDTAVRTVYPSCPPFLTLRCPQPPELLREAGYTLPSDYDMDDDADKRGGGEQTGEDDD